MAFPPRFLDEIKARLGLAEVVGRRVRLIRKGREHSGLCPFHKEKTPSFTVNEEKGFYHCFGCGAHGSLFDFVMQTEGLNFPEAVERLAAEAGLQIPVDKFVSPDSLLAHSTRSNDREIALMESNSTEDEPLLSVGKHSLVVQGFIRSGIQHFKATVEDFITKLSATSVEFAKIDGAPNVPLEISHNHVRDASEALSRAPKENPPTAWVIAGQVGEYIATGMAGVGAGQIKSENEIHAWAIWLFVVSTAVGIVLLVVRLSRRKRGRG